MQEFYSFAQHIYRSAVKSGLIQLYKSFLFQLCWLCRQICSTFVTINKHRTSPVILCFSNILTNVQIKMSYHFFNKSFGLGQHLHSVRQYNFWHVIDSRECDVTSTCDGTVLNLTSTCDSTCWCDILMSHQRDFTSMWCHINVMSHQCDINVMSHQWYTLQQCDVTSMWCPVWRYRVIRIKGAAEVDMTLHSYSCLVCAVHVHLQNTRPLSSVGLQSVQGYMNTGSSSSPACPPPTICSPLIGGFNDKRWNDLSYVCHSREGRGGVGVVGMGQGRWGGGGVTIGRVFSTAHPLARHRHVMTRRLTRSRLKGLCWDLFGPPGRGASTFERGRGRGLGGWVMRCSGHLYPCSRISSWQARVGREYSLQ